LTPTRLSRLRVFGATLVLAAVLSSCGGNGQVPLVTVDVAVPDSCWLLYRVIDVAADSTVGTVDKATGATLKWPTGFTAWRVGAEVEVRDTAGKAVLTTGSRYRLSPANNGGPFNPDTDWAVVNCPRPCPECELGEGLL
jgi:hypothetical protein